MIRNAVKTRVLRIDSISTPECDLWIKRDDETNAIYGGNKIRKLDYLLDDASTRRATRILTVGAIGSHHVLATTIHGTRRGFAVDAVLVPQPSTPHVIDTRNASIAAGLNAIYVRSYAQVPFAILRHMYKYRGQRTYFIPVGGSNVLGSMGYVDAALELMDQVRAGEIPEPDLHVVALGSGGTAAGIAAGLEIAKSKGGVIGVSVAPPARLLGGMTIALARACVRRRAREIGLKDAGGSWCAMVKRIEIDVGYMGEGYGYATPAGDDAMDVGRSLGIALDATYTAKAFAAARAIVDGAQKRGARTVLYWHTLG